MLIARAVQALTTVARHAIPVGGLFGRDWHPVTALAIYWTESVLLVLAVASLCALLRRRTSHAARAAAHHAGEGDEVRAIDTERAELAAASIAPGDVLVFHLGSLLVFGAFLGGILLILFGNGRIDEPMRWGELREGLLAIGAVVTIGFLVDLWRFDNLSVADARGRVDACLSRWGLFWILGFFGTIAIAYTERASTLFGLFAGLKITFESYARLARLFGWQSLKDREAAESRKRMEQSRV